MALRFLSIILVLSLLATTTTLAATLSGKVVSVADGDTITILTPDKQQVKIRLVEIDAPEKDQPYGQTSKKALSDLVFGKDVSVEWDKTDKYKRTLGRVFVGDTDVNLQQVKNGAAWAYMQYLSDEKIKKAEEEARNSKAGIWALQADQIMPPWDWRHGKKENIQEIAPVAPAPTDGNSRYSCAGKQYCREMTSCEEAKFYLKKCGLKRLDGDSDGVPCEKVCR